MTTGSCLDVDLAQLKRQVFWSIVSERVDISTYYSKLDGAPCS